MIHYCQPGRAKHINLPKIIDNLQGEVFRLFKNVREALFD
jgi:hypothetical protein